jgi:hypothetical protein
VTPSIVLRGGLTAWLCAALLSPLASPSRAAPQEVQEALTSLTEAELRDHVFFLASDRLEGRDAEGPGYRLAADYAAIHFAQAGLEPTYTDSAGNPSYFQSVRFLQSALTPETSLVLNRGGNRTSLAWGEDFVVQEVMARGVDEAVTGTPVFLGYGIHEPELGWNDYEGLDLNGRMGVIMAGAPVRDGAPVLPEDRHRFYGNLQQSANARLQAAMDKGLSTVIVVLDSASIALWDLVRSQASNPSTRFSVEEDPAGPRPALAELVLVRPQAAGILLAGTGLDPMTGLGEYTPGEMEGLRMDLTTRHALEGEWSSPNVVGLLPGTDPALADEHVVVTAHLDHVGVRDGAVFNGADDNASGSAAVLEAAEAAALAPGRRPILFVLLTAEEKGLLGSQAFVSHPPVPVQEMVLNINLDMVGRNSTDFPEVLLAMASENGRAPLLAMIREVNEVVGAPLDWRLNEGPDPHSHVLRSDQLSFMQQGVPAILITRGFMGPDYHEPSDDPDTINYEKVLHAARLTLGLAEEAANRDLLEFR